ncbi:MAG: hypothetical protein NTV43_09200 [Methylococcales bacterium]|nr:hypothetical protein [Methylococcales bacterium]
MYTIELEDETALILNQLAMQQGKTVNEWIKGLAAQFVRIGNYSSKPQRPIGLAKDKGAPLPDAFFEPLPDELLAAFNGSES